uniref:Expansin-like EG45 domain-containing protein n=1 Tax=Tetradesmus obliquus TaxID=3088 RepID=A0A383VYW9_TETOB|eukprot:jgi/Sobl393_1/2324/SZX69606.1
MKSSSELDWKWRTGRATYYGTDDWSIHKGSCGYGALWRDEPHGWDVAAMTDYHPDYADSCGSCYEVACDSLKIQDNYGAKLDRTYSCYDSSQSVVLRITDTCPCTYPANAYSNKRWCCNDMDHFDVSVWAFEKLADKKWGVIGIKYRRVPCDYQPQNVAPAVSNASPFPSEAKWGQDRPRRDWPEYTGQRDSDFIFDNSLDNNWWDASWNTWLQSPKDAKESGMRKGQALCANIKSQGALALKTNSGAFQNKYKLEFWVYVGVSGWEGTSATVPDIKISLRGTKGQCNVLKIYDVKPDAFEPTCNYCADYFWRFTFHLPYFNGEWSHSTFNDPSQFASGCGGNTVWDINQIEFRNDWGGDKWVCLDRIALV